MEDRFVTTGSDNVFADLGMPNPEERLMRSALVFELHTVLKARKLRKDAAARLLDLPAPVTADLLKGRFVDLPLAQLFDLLVRLNRDVEIRIRPMNEGARLHVSALPA